MGGVTNEKGLEGRNMQKLEVGETSTLNLATIEVDLKKTIKMIVEQENVALASMQEKNENVI
jgi:hypothetical protein